MITIDFSKRNNLGLCEFLYESIKEQILENILKANEKLPSKRALAVHLGISVITVQNAYGQLISEGYIYSIEKKGFFVTDIAVENQFFKRKQFGKKSEKNTCDGNEVEYDYSQVVSTEKKYFVDLKDDDIPVDSLLREFIGGSIYE